MKNKTLKITALGYFALVIVIALGLAVAACFINHNYPAERLGLLVAAVLITLYGTVTAVIWRLDGTLK